MRVVGESLLIDRSFVRSGSVPGRVGSSNLVEVQLFLAEGQSVQTRDPASGTERLPFPTPSAPR